MRLLFSQNQDAPGEDSINKANDQQDSQIKSIIHSFISQILSQKKYELSPPKQGKKTSN